MPRSHLFFVASAFLLALGAVLAKVLLSFDGASNAAIDPLPFLTFQLLGGVVFLVGARIARGWGAVPLGVLVHPALAGVILGCGSVGTIFALALITASEASVVFATQPVMILGLAWFVLGEKSPLSTAILALVAVVGVIGIVVGGGLDASPSRVAGLSFAFFSTASAAIYVVWMRGLSGRVDTLTALLVVQIVACAVSSVIWCAADISGLVRTETGSVFLVLCAVGSGAIYYGAAFYIYLIGLQKTEVYIAGVYLSLVPVFTIGLAWVFLSERLTALQWAGAALVIFAIGGMAFLSARADRRVSDQSRTIHGR
ncbi:MAG: DMT family transporter [Pseudomonadota bacterium]